MKFNETFGITLETQFTEQDLSQESLDWVESESHRIASGVIDGEVSRNSLTGKYRSYDDIKSDARHGVIAEAYLMEHYDYTENTRKWHDVITPAGIEVEVKTYNGHSIQTRFNQILKLESRKTKYKHVIMFKRLDGVYTFDSYWVHNDKDKLYEEVICQTSKPTERLQ